MNNNNKTLGIIGMVCGIVSLLLAFIGLILGFWFRAGGWMALIAIILGVVGIVLGAASKKSGGSGTAGLVTGIIGIVFAVITGMSCIICNACGYYKVTDAYNSLVSGDYDDDDLEDWAEDMEDLFD